MRNSWSIGLNSWILTDGNYPDFQTGQERQFALEFHSGSFENSDSQIKSAEILDRSTYRINGLVSYIDSEMWVLDFGVQAYRHRCIDCVPGSGRPEASISEETFVSNLKVGQYVQAKIHLSVDSYSYMEHLCDNVGVPPLIYTWTIDAIYKQCGPMIKGPADKNLPSGYFMIDEKNAKWHKVEFTLDRIEDFQGEMELQCTLSQVEPTADGKPLANWDG